MLPNFRQRSSGTEERGGAGSGVGGFRIPSAWSSYLPYVDTFKKRACRFILHHYLGRFLKDHLTLDQLTIDLYNGTGSLHNVPIDIYNVNELLESQGIPIELVGGTIATITVSIPWANIFQKPTKVEIHSLHIAIKGQSPSSDSIFLSDSYFNSLTTSMRLAQQCFKQDDETAFQSESLNTLPHSDGFSTSAPGSDKPQGEALEFFAQAIEAVLLKVKIALINTKVRFEPNDPWSDSIEIVINNIDFFDDSASSDAAANCDQTESNEDSHQQGQEAAPKFFTSNFSTKVFKIEGMTINHVPNSCNKNKVMTEVLTNEQMDDAMGRNFHSQGHPDYVTIGAFLGKMEANIKIKQVPNVAGGRLEIDCFLGSLSLFVEPKHLKVLIDVMNGFLDASNAESNSEPGTLKKKATQPSMYYGSNTNPSSSQFEHDVTNQFLSMNFNPTSGTNASIFQSAVGMPSMRGSHAAFIQNNMTSVYNDEDFYSIYDDHSEHNSMTSSMISATTTATNTTLNNTQDFGAPRAGGSSNLGATGECSTSDPIFLNIRFNGLSMVLLESNHSNFRDLSPEFFTKIKQATDSQYGFGAKDVYTQKKIIQSACNFNHLTLLACPVKARFVLDQSKRHSSKTNILLTFAFFEISECLHTPTGKEVSTIVTFTNQKHFTSNQLVTQPNMKIDITFSTNISRKTGQESKKKLAVLLELAPTILNLDLTILDRLIEFFQPSIESNPGFVGNHNLFSNDFKVNIHDVDDDCLADRPLDVNTSFEFKCSDLELTFYIPIPVFEPSNTYLVTTQRLIRNEAFMFAFSKLFIKTDFVNWEEDLSVLLETSSVDLFLVSNQISLKLCRIGSDANNKNSKPFVSFKLFPFHCELSHTFQPFDMNTASMYDSFPCDFTSNSSNKSGPFSSKVLIHNSQPVIKCGNFQELSKFSDDCLSDSRLVLKISLPDVSLFIPNKSVFDLVYNRFSNDLLLWEPLFSKLDSTDLESSTHSVGLGLSSQAAAVTRSKQHFSMCKSGIRSAYSSTEQENEGDGSEGRGSASLNDSSDFGSKDEEGTSQNWLSIQLKFGTVKLSMSDVNPKDEKISFQSFCDLKNGNLFVVAGYSGSANTTYITFSCYDGQYYHSEENVVCKPFSFDDNLNVHFPSYLDMKLRKSKLDILESEHQQSFSNPVLSTAVQITSNRAKNFKHIKVAVNLEGMTLMQRFDQKQWITQFVEMFNPKDELVPGYDFLPVLTELHLSLTNCAVLYRPLHLPYTLLLNTGCVYISSNMVADSPSSIFQIIIEAASLNISCIRSLKSCLSDFAKVIDTGLVSLDVVTQKHTSGQSQGQSTGQRKEMSNESKTEIRLNCDILNFYTCSDSLQVLSQIVKYLAANGDNPSDPQHSNSTVPISTDPSVGKEEKSDNIEHGNKPGEGNPEPVNDGEQQIGSGENESYSNRVMGVAACIEEGGGDESGPMDLNEMIHEAINEDLFASTHPNYSLSADQNVFLFPDEPQISGEERKERDTEHHNVHTDLMNNQSETFSSDNLIDQSEESRMPLSLSPSDSFEGEVHTGNGDEVGIGNYPAAAMMASQFCVIESPFVRKNAFEIEDCTIVYLNDNEHLECIENHFEKPMPGKRDMLKPASYLPQPIHRYHVQEFNVSWKLYAGCDFPGLNGMKSGRDKNNLVEVCLRKIEVLYDQYEKGEGSKITTQTSNSSSTHFGSKNTTSTKGDARGEYKSRLVVACDDIEVLDRISMSAINKLMYCYSAENCLRQAHAHMVLLKVLECAPTEKNQLGSEYIVRLNALPVRLNFDQHTVFFLSNFFFNTDSDNGGGFNSNNTKPNSNEVANANQQKRSPKAAANKVQFSKNTTSPVHGEKSSQSKVSFKCSNQNEHTVQLPPSSKCSSESTQDRSSGSLGDGNVDVGGARSSIRTTKTATTTSSSEELSSLRAKYVPMNATASSQSNSTSFIKEFTFLSDVMIKFDYHGKYFDMDRGKFIGLLIGLAQVQCSHLVLKRLQVNQGILGFDNLVLYCLTEWMNDIKKNQISNLIGGIGPMYSFTQIVHGLVDLVYMPIEQYRRDGRILKGFQKGAASFTTSSTSAALQLVNRLLDAVHFTAETAFDLLSPNANTVASRHHHHLLSHNQYHSHHSSRHYVQPNDLREGLNMAYKTLYEGLNETALTIVREAVDGRDCRGLTGAVGGVLRQIPPTLIAPVILASEATSNVIHGVSHQIAPDYRNEALQKWK